MIETVPSSHTSEFLITESVDIYMQGVHQNKNEVEQTLWLFLKI